MRAGRLGLELLSSYIVESSCVTKQMENSRNNDH